MECRQSPFSVVVLGKRVGEAKVGHVRTTCRTVHNEEAQTHGRNVIEFRICMCHQLIRFLCGCIKGKRIVNLVIHTVRNLLVRAINRRRSIHQMIQILTVAAGFKDIKKTNQVGFHISIRVGDGVTHTSLCRKVNNHRRLILLKQIGNPCLVSNMTFDKSECRIDGTLSVPHHSRHSCCRCR